MESISKSYLFVIALLLVSPSIAQKITKHKLSEELNEISGLELLNDTTLVAINDSGNEHDDELITLSLNGSIFERIKLNNAKNIDWEDLASTDSTIVIGDVGNNFHQRNTVHFYTVQKEDFFRDTLMFATVDSVKYNERLHKFPDVEACAFDGSQLVLFDKNDLKSKGLPTTIFERSKDVYIPISLIDIGKSGKYKDAVTGADIYNDKLYLLTYNRIIVCQRLNEGWVLEQTIRLKGLKQYEAIVVYNENRIFVANEKRFPLGGPSLYEIRIND